MVEFLLGRPAQDLMAEAVQLETVAIQESPGSQATVFTASRTCHGLQLLWAGELDAARDLSDLVRKLQYGQRVKVIWLRCTSNPLRPSQGPPRAPAYGWRTIVR